MNRGTTAEELIERIRIQSGAELAMLHELWREEAHVGCENAMDNEQRLRAQATANIHKDLAAIWRDDARVQREAQEQEAALDHGGE